MRTFTTERTTRETSITATITLPDTIPLTAAAAQEQRVTVDTGIPFFDHMLNAFFFHGGFSVDLSAQGDVAVDFHHTVEDTGIVIGSLLARVPDEVGPVCRFGHGIVPMDDSLAEVVIDAGGRSYLVYSVEYPQPHAGTFDLALVREFFTGLTSHARANVHILGRYGLNGHHLAEAVFKAAGRALALAYLPTGTVLSTKGVL